MCALAWMLFPALQCSVANQGLPPQPVHDLCYPSQSLILLYST